MNVTLEKLTRQTINGKKNFSKKIFADTYPIDDFVSRIYTETCQLDNKIDDNNWAKFYLFFKIINFLNYKLVFFTFVYL